MSTSLRTAGPGDLPTLAELATAGAGTHWTQSQLARFCQPLLEGPAATQGSLVAERDGAVIAFILLSSVLDEAEIINVVVAGTARRQGLGRQLLRGAMQALRTRGVRVCHLEVGASNAAAIGLYRSEGFIECGRRAGYYSMPDGATEDALLMSKNLSGDES